MKKLLERLCNPLCAGEYPNLLLPNEPKVHKPRSQAEIDTTPVGTNSFNDITVEQIINLRSVIGGSVTVIFTHTDGTCTSISLPKNSQLKQLVVDVRYTR